MPASNSSGVLTLEDLANFVESMKNSSAVSPDYFVVSAKTMKQLKHFEALHKLYVHICPRGMPKRGKVRKVKLRRLQARIAKAKRRLARRERAEERRLNEPIRPLEHFETPLMDMMPRLQSNHGVYDFKSIQSIFEASEENQ